jgi:hypothetical protein
MRSFKKNILRTEQDVVPFVGDCVMVPGGTFKGLGGYDATFGYTDCNGDLQSIIAYMPINPEPGNQCPFEISLEGYICAIQGSVYRIAPSVIPALTITYDGPCV